MDNSLKEDRMLTVVVSVLCVSQTGLTAHQGSGTRGHLAMPNEIKRSRISGEDCGSHGKSGVLQSDINTMEQKRSREGLHQGCALL